MSQAIKDLLGNSFIDKSGATFDASKLAGKVIGIYFSAHWCPPCRGFTPQLAKTYETITKAGKNFEVVFASSDKDEEAFKEYLGEMPWIAIPFADRAKKAELSKKFKVQGIPTLVIVDENGEVINARGREAVGGDLSGHNFPWKAKTLLETLPPFVVNHKGEHVSLETLKKAELLGFYFSAHWCPPCKGFTPVLAECYKKLKAKGKNVEIVFVSSDRDEKSFKEYFETMPWLALPFENSDANSQLSDAFEVEGIPQLTFINPATGKVVIADGRSAVSEDPEGNEYPWPEKPMRGLQSGTALFNDKACLIVLADKLAADQAEEANKALTTVSSQFFEGRFKNVEDKPLAFIFGSDKDAELAERVRGFLKLDEKATHVIMDIPNGQKFVGTGGLSAADLHKFADDFLAGSLSPKGLKE